MSDKTVNGTVEKIYVVMGITGPGWTITDEWLVAAFTTKETAVEHAQNAELRAHEWKDSESEWSEPPDDWNPFDFRHPGAGKDIMYFIVEILLFDVSGKYA